MYGVLKQRSDGHLGKASCQRLLLPWKETEDVTPDFLLKVSGSPISCRYPHTPRTIKPPRDRLRKLSLPSCFKLKHTTNGLARQGGVRHLHFAVGDVELVETELRLTQLAGSTIGWVRRVRTIPAQTEKPLSPRRLTWNPAFVVEIPQAYLSEI